MQEEYDYSDNLYVPEYEYDVDTSLLKPEEDLGPPIYETTNPEEASFH